MNCKECGQLEIECECYNLPLKSQVGGDHYKKHPIQPWEIIVDWKCNFFEGNVIKYILRDKKSKVEDLKKACHYVVYTIEITLGTNDRVFATDPAYSPTDIAKVYNLTLQEAAALQTLYNSIMSRSLVVQVDLLKVVKSELQNEIKRINSSDK